MPLALPHLEFGPLGYLSTRSRQRLYQSQDEDGSQPLLQSEYPIVTEPLFELLPTNQRIPSIFFYKTRQLYPFTCGPGDIFVVAALG